MTVKKNIKSLSQSVEKFLENRKSLSESEKKIEAGFLIREINSVNIDNAFLKINKRINRRNKTKSRITLLTRVAAVLSLPLLAFTIWSLFIANDSAIFDNPQISWQEIQSPAGMRSHIVLPDGTDLWLNAGSKIKYGIPFVRETRHVDLSGEAFLKVARNDDVPFIVNSGNTEVKVLGTQFNINAFPDDNHIDIALLEGSVEFYYVKNDGKKVFTILEPNDYLVLNKEKSTISKENKNVEKYISWHKNILIFDDTPMLEVAAMLERWYGVKVVIASEEIKKYKFTTTFENEPLARVLELLELSSPISVTYTAGKINKKSNSVTPSVVTITKK